MMVCVVVWLNVEMVVLVDDVEEGNGVWSGVDEVCG